MNFYVPQQPEARVPYTNQEMLNLYSGHLNDVYPSKTWYTVVYNAESSIHLSSHLCRPGNCIQMMNFLNRYNLLAIGVDGEPNAKLLASTGWLNFLQSQPTSDAFK